MSAGVASHLAKRGNSLWYFLVMQKFLVILMFLCLFLFFVAYVYFSLPGDETRATQYLCEGSDTAAYPQPSGVIFRIL